MTRPKRKQKPKAKNIFKQNVFTKTLKNINHFDCLLISKERKIIGKKLKEK